MCLRATLSFLFSVAFSCCLAYNFVSDLYETLSRMDGRTDRRIMDVCVYLVVVSFAVRHFFSIVVWPVCARVSVSMSMCLYAERSSAYLMI